MDVMQSMFVFKRVAEAGSFSAVARENGMSQSSVSKHVAALEQRLGTKLLNRSTRQLSLTETGSEYYHYCVRIVAEFEEAEARVGQGQARPQGKLRLTAAAPFGRNFIVPFLPTFLKAYPELSIDLILEDRYVDLLKEGVDLAIRVGPLADSSLVARRLGSCPRFMLASPDYLARRGEPTSPEDLINHDCVIHTLMDSPTTWQLVHGTDIQEVPVHGRLRVSSPDILGDVTRAGLGISIMCGWAVQQDIERGTLKVLLPDYPPPAFEVSAVYPQRQFVPRKVSLLIEHLRESFQGNCLNAS